MCKKATHSPGIPTDLCTGQFDNAIARISGYTIFVSYSFCSTTSNLATGKSKMTPLRTYKIFISHAWRYSDNYSKVIEFLQAAPNFSWTNLSVPKHDPLETSPQLQARLNDQMRPANAFLILGGMYVSYSDWIQYEINFARRIGRPIIGIRPWGSERTPDAVTSAAKEIVGWNTDSIVSAIRRHALADGL